MPIIGSSKYGYFLDGRIPNFRRIEGNRGELLSPYRFAAPDGRVHIAQPGLIYDGASIPKALWGFSTNPWADDVLAPATIHDWYCSLGRAGKSPLPSPDAHHLFYLGLKAIGVPEWRARARWLAVRTAGPHFKGMAEEPPSDKAA